MAYHAVKEQDTVVECSGQYHLRRACLTVTGWSCLLEGMLVQRNDFMHGPIMVWTWLWLHAQDQLACSWQHAFTPLPAQFACPLIH